MTVTNNHNLPLPIFLAVQNDSYDKGDCDYSATELLIPPRARALMREHKDEITEDASELIFRLIGDIGHLLLERAGEGSGYVEKRFFADIAGRKVSGKADLICLPDQGHQLIDYKFTSIYTTMDGPKREWTEQLNILAYLAKRNGVDIGSANIVAIYRDWSKPKAAREKDYPKSQVAVLPIELWPEDKQREFITYRIVQHEAAKTALPLCTPEERWQTPNQWAVKKKGNKRATRVFDNEEQAEAAVTFGDNMEIEFRPGESKRCECYCAAAPFCSQYLSTKI